MKIVAQRLHNQQLDHTTLKTPADVVAYQGAVQAQEFALAKWALGMRLNGAVETDIDRAFNSGEILRTHVMRPTWHFVAREDIRWLLELTAPRVNIVNGTMYRKLELDEALLMRCNDVIAKALEGGKQLMRAQLADALAQAGIVADGMRLGYIVHRAELDAVICSGARWGKQHTYALLDERAPDAKRRPRDEALAELTRRFFTSHGPATARDFAWWSGLTLADVKEGLALNQGGLVSETFDGLTWWYAPSSVTDIQPVAHLLPPYDEYVIAFRDNSGALDPAHLEQARSAILGGVTVIGGQIVGNWRRSIFRGSLLIESAPFRPFSPAENAAFVAGAQRYGEFMQLPVELAVSS